MMDLDNPAERIGSSNIFYSVVFLITLLIILNIISKFVKDIIKSPTVEQKPKITYYIEIKKNIDNVSIVLYVTLFMIFILLFPPNILYNMFNVNLLNNKLLLDQVDYRVLFKKVKEHIVCHIGGGHFCDFFRVLFYLLKQYSIIYLI
jgi:hypothetical protein